MAMEWFSAGRLIRVCDAELVAHYAEESGQDPSRVAGHVGVRIASSDGEDGVMITALSYTELANRLVGTIEGLWASARAEGEVHPQTPAARVLVVRDPDASNDITTDGAVKVIDIDLGYSFDGSPGDAEEAVGFAEGVLSELEDVPFDSPVLARALETVTETVRAYGDASALVEAFTKRHGL